MPTRSQKLKNHQGLCGRPRQPRSHDARAREKIEGIKRQYLPGITTRWASPGPPA